MVACGSNKLAIVPEMSVVSSDAMISQTWPVQPIKLLSVPSGHLSAKDNHTNLIVVVGENGSVWLVSLLHGQLPMAPTTSASTSSSHAVVLDACVNGTFISIAKQLEPLATSSTVAGQQKSKAVKGNKDTSTGASNCMVLTWSIPHMEGIHANALLFPNVLSALHSYPSHSLIESLSCFFYLF